MAVYAPSFDRPRNCTARPSAQVSSVSWPLFLSFLYVPGVIIAGSRIAPIAYHPARQRSFRFVPLGSPHRSLIRTLSKCLCDFVRPPPTKLRQANPSFKGQPHRIEVRPDIDVTPNRNSTRRLTIAVRGGGQLCRRSRSIPMASRSRSTAEDRIALGNAMRRYPANLARDAKPALQHHRR